MAEKFPKVIARTDDGAEMIATGKVKIGDYTDYAIYIRTPDGRELAKERPVPLQQFLKHDDRDWKRTDEIKQA